jgi:hypothetical protein
MLEVARPRKIFGGDAGRSTVDLARRSTLGKRGRTRIGSLLILLLLALTLYVGVQAISAYFVYWSLTDAVRSVIRDVTISRQRVEDADVEGRIMAKAREHQLFLSERQVVVTVDAQRILAQVWWQQPIGFYGFTIPLFFEIEESGPLR